jgi:hypothetical protein
MLQDIRGQQAFRLFRLNNEETAFTYRNRSSTTTLVVFLVCNCFARPSRSFPLLHRQVAHIWRQRLSIHPNLESCMYKTPKHVPGLLTALSALDILSCHEQRLNCCNCQSGPVLAHGHALDSRLSTARPMLGIRSRAFWRKMSPCSILILMGMSDGQYAMANAMMRWITQSGARSTFLNPVLFILDSVSNISGL